MASTVRLVALTAAMRAAHMWRAEIVADPAQMGDMARELGVAPDRLVGATLECVPDNVASHVATELRAQRFCPCPPCLAYRAVLGVRS